MTGIYDDPWAYELACSFREVPAEVEVLLAWCAEHRPEGAGPVRTVLELAAGPAEHAREMARRGLTATALDLNPAMCAHAAAEAGRAGVALEVVQDDMTRFDLGRRFDLVVTMLDSTSHLMTLDAFVAHLRRVAAHLAPDGLYVVEMSHPRDRLGGDEPSVSTGWTVERGGVRATVRWGEPSDRLDPITQVSDDQVTMTIDGDGSGGREPRVIRDVVPYRFWTATEVDAAVRLAGGLAVAAQYGDFGAGEDAVPLTGPDAWRMLTVLRPA
ncbi:bifunctional 2-polyprenyl-6-hydroxyphenol methylase/3-demethylubiquinol 3-O-methyltransferase UbiG [Actinomadura sp. NEAU-AAG7]|uniref:class I SAM-dependent methyltransferase n=1 Tax=Actinomadura sp. NEAU-AAG7 TaxID=2839640 RepID=UPI001BE420B0|nr:class I SAM-dependent methyltransferase [Actinomadura sp. NEAU-AAG7]MBT2211694.1 class I SAM-dependent methyltransferase [Actinomadura sp. NEAU-AAG7]